MKILRFIISATLAVALTYALNTKFGIVPPLGKFLDPVSGFWANAETEEITIPEHLHMDNLKVSITIKYDDMMVPHIFAENDEDLYFAQGYAHAYHRLWQMEFQTHAAAGRISEIVGSAALDLDRGQRRKGMIYGAERFMEEVQKDAVSLLAVQQYTAGVNAYINSLKPADLPFEFKLLGYEPEPWTQLKCGLLLKYMSNMLNTGEKDLQNTNFRNIYGKELLDLIYPDIDNVEDPIVDRTGAWGFTALTTRSEDIEGSADAPVSIDPLPQPSVNNGSNNWAVGPEKSATGNPLLCNDMHLGLNMPSLWYYNQLSAPGVNVMGHSLLGVPGVIQGFNDSIAWGFTNAQRDLVDWFVIDFKDERMEEYYLDDDWVKVEKRIEEIKLRGEESYFDTVSYTVFGPVVYDNNYRSESQKKGYAMRWIAHDPSSEFKMFYLLNRSKNLEDYIDATNYFSSPAQNVVFAAVDGTIAHRISGKFPVNEFEEGKFIKDGTKSENNWTAFIPPEHYAYWVNPERGFVSSANQHPADTTYPYYVTARSYESYRNRRINDVLRADSSVTVDDMKALHYDNFSMKAEESLPMMLAYLDSVELTTEEQTIADMLGTWDYMFESDSKAATWFDAWFNNLFISIWDEIGDSEYSLTYPTNYSTINLMQNNPDLDFFDNQSTEEEETLRDVIYSSFKITMEKINEWEEENPDGTWADYKGTFLRHLSRQKPLGVYNIHASGNRGDIVNATGPNHGPSERIIIELDPSGVKAWGHYPGGQSGNPGSPYYDNMVDAWANGEYFELLFLKSSEEENERVIFSQTMELPHK
jgi:penicillin amidase